MKKIFSIVGARPQFIKVAPLSRELRKHFDERIIHTGQHYDYEMSKGFFDELGIPEPDFNLEVGSGSPAYQIGTMLMKLEEIFQKEKPDAVIVFGDTNSTAAASIASVKCGIPFGHVEAGLREFNKYIPEESNKLITDILCDYYFCPTNTAVEILDSMGIRDHVYNVGDVMIDIIWQNMKTIESNTAILDKFGVSKKDYVFMTCHRAANTDDAKKLKAILESLEEIRFPVVFPIHPRTLKVAEQNGFMPLLEKSNVILSKPLGYFDTQSLIRFSNFVFTDSGGVTKEAYFHKVPGILLDTQTEWVETIQEGWNQQAGPFPEKISEAIKNVKIPEFHSNCLGDGKASEKIANILLKNLYG